MKTSKIEQSIKKVIKSNGDFSSLEKQLDKVFESKDTFRPKKSKTRLLVPLISVGAVLTQIVVVLSAISIFVSINNRHHGSIDGPSTVSNTEPHSGEIVGPYKKYQWFEFLDKKYRCASLDYETISESLIGENIAELEISATHSLGDKTEYANVTINLIQNVDKNYGLAVKFESENGYYFYVTDALETEINLQNFLNSVGLLEYGTFDSASYSYFEGEELKTAVSNNVDTLIRETMIKNNEIKNVYSLDPSSPYNNFDTNISVRISMPLLGNVTTFLNINLDGRANFSLINDNTFVFDSDDISSLKDYILNNKI